MPAGVSQPERRADGEVVGVRKDSLESTAPVRAEPVERGVRPLLPAQLQHLRDAPARARRPGPSSPRARPSPARTPATTVATPGAAQRVGGRDDGRREAVLRGERVVGVELARDRAFEGVPEPLREHRDRGDEREADHQRGRGRGGPARVAHGVRTRELSGHPADQRRRPARESRRAAGRGSGRRSRRR